MFISDTDLWSAVYLRMLTLYKIQNLEKKSTKSSSQTYEVK
jgi:hypothetical protein